MDDQLTVKSERKPSEAHENTRPVRTFIPKVDITETEDALWLWADLPGVASDDVDIRLENGRLSIEGSVGLDEYSNLSPLYTEYNVGNYVRSFEISNEIDSEAIEARVSNGVLELKLPKSERARPRRIPISAH